MRLDYGTQISPSPIRLSIGTLKKPTLEDISALTFDKFSYFEFLMKMTPELYYTKLKVEYGKKYWDSISENKRDEMTMYDIIISDEAIRNSYLDLLRFFFVEPIIFSEDFFILLKKDITNMDELIPENVHGVISKESFSQVLELMQQICCIYSEEESKENLKFKNALAKKLYEKMLKAEKEKNKKADMNLSLPNIISSLSNKHPSINYTNVWNLTVFQLMDSFNRVQTNTMYDIDSTRVSVWGDEKKTFDFTLWYKNNYDKNGQSKKTD